MVLASMGANFLTHLVNMLVGHKYPTRPRVIFALLLNVVLFAVSIIFTKVNTKVLFTISIILTKVNTDPWQLGYYGLSLTICLLLNMSDSVLQGGACAPAAVPQLQSGHRSLHLHHGEVPPRLPGRGVGGPRRGGRHLLRPLPRADGRRLVTIECRLPVSSLPPGGGDLVGVATWYFLCGPLFLLATLGVYILLNRHTYYQHFLDERGEQEAAARAGAGQLGHLAVIRRTWRWNLTVFLTYVVLYSLYPALLRLVEPVHDTEAWRQVLVHFSNLQFSLIKQNAQPKGDTINLYFQYMVSLGVMFLYAILDCSGCVAATLLQWPGPTVAGGNLCVAAAVARLALVPLLLVCNLSPASRRLTPVIIHSDAAFLLLHAVSSFSGSYL